MRDRPRSQSANSGLLNQQQEPELPREKPILFSADMVRAILDGRKTQTRRVVADYNSEGNYKASEMDLSRAWPDSGKLKSYLAREVTLARGFEPDEIIERLYPRYEMGDRLWVRETFCPVDDRDHGGVQWIDYRATPRYSAEHPAGWDAAPEDCEALKWRPSIFMPRPASRITLEVTDVRVERVRQISVLDAVAEGRRCEHGYDYCTRCGEDPVQRYAHLWNALNEKRGYGWDKNPWVWVIEFRRIDAAALELAVDQRSISEAATGGISPFLGHAKHV